MATITINGAVSVTGDVTINGAVQAIASGTDTSDATMAAGDLALGETGYGSAGTKITGTSTFDADTTVKNLLPENYSNIETEVPSFELNDGNEVLTQDLSEHWEGLASLKIVTPNVGANEGITGGGYYPAPAVPHTYSLYIKGSGTLNFTLTDNNEATDTTLITCTASWVRYDLTITPASGAIVIYLTTDIQQAATFYIDGLQLEKAEAATAWVIGKGAHITADTIPLGFVGYVNGEMIVGTMESWPPAG